MDIKSLKYFIAVAQELNITKAAEKLNISQPPLSTQIKNLEYELDTTLFIRGKRHLQLTESGKLLYRRALEITDLAKKAESEIISMNKGLTGTISLGLVEGMAPDIAADWIVGFTKKYPNAKFRILDGNSDDLIEKLRSGLISLAVISSPYDQHILNAFPVGKEKITAFMNKNHPLAKKDGDEIEIADLKNEPLIIQGRKSDTDNIYKWFRDIKSEPKIICAMDSYLDAAALAGKGVGISIFPGTEYINNENLVSKPITGENRFTEYFFAWHKGHPLPTVEETFIDFVKSAVLNKI